MRLVVTLCKDPFGRLTTFFLDFPSHSSIRALKSQIARKLQIDAGKIVLERQGKREAEEEWSLEEWGCRENEQVMVGVSEGVEEVGGSVMTKMQWLVALLEVTSI